jgi:hypothetical protein
MKSPRLKKAQHNAKPTGFKRLKALVSFLAESFLTILLVLSFFSVFLYFLNAIFPAGISLKSVVNQKTLYKAGMTPGDLGKESGDVVAGSVRELAATVSRTRNAVKSKPAEAIAWMSAAAGKQLYDRDAVQTLDQSEADISFDENTILGMGENSLLIIKKQTHDPLFLEKRSFMVLVDGDLRGKIDGSNPNSVILDIGTPTASIHTRGGAATKKALDFKISVNPDKSSTIAVYSGSAEVAANGKMVTVGANEATIVAMGQSPLKPRAIPKAVVLGSPSSGHLVVYRDLPSLIRFDWKAQPETTGYHFLLARDPDFSKIVTDDIFEKNSFRHGNLVKGTYYWRVSARYDSIQGNFSKTRRLDVIQDKAPPMLEVQFPPETVYGGRFNLEGKTEPGVRVFIGGVRVETGHTGKFTYPLILQPGINVIVVEAFDGVNNAAYRSKRVVSK